MSWLQTGLRILATMLVVGVLCQCKTVREVKSTRSTGYRFAGIDDQQTQQPQSERSQGILNQEKIIKNSDGEVVGKEKKGEILDGEARMAREAGETFRGSREARFEKESFATREFKTPEYLQRQEYGGTRMFATDEARESGRENTRLVQRLFRTETRNSAEDQARESGVRSRADGKLFGTSFDRANNDAAKAAKPTGVPREPGYHENLLMSMDDVKKLVNPSSMELVSPQ